MLVEAKQNHISVLLTNSAVNVKPAHIAVFGPHAIITSSRAKDFVKVTTTTPTELIVTGRCLTYIDMTAVNEGISLKRANVVAYTSNVLKDDETAGYIVPSLYIKFRPLISLESG